MGFNNFITIVAFFYNGFSSLDNNGNHKNRIKSKCNKSDKTQNKSHF